MSFSSNFLSIFNQFHIDFYVCIFLFPFLFSSIFTSQGRGQNANFHHCFYMFCIVIITGLNKYEDCIPPFTHARALTYREDALRTWIKMFDIIAKGLREIICLHFRDFQTISNRNRGNSSGPLYDKYLSSF